MITAPERLGEGFAFKPEIFARLPDTQTNQGNRVMRYPLHATILLLALAFPCSVSSTLDDAKTKAISNASDAFTRLAGNSANTGQAPRQTDPTVKPLLDLVFDTSELQKGATQPMSALANLNAWQGAVLKIGLVYTLAGTRVTDIAALPNTPEIMQKLERNTVEFAPEMGRYRDAILWVQGALMDTTATFLATASPSQRDQPNIKSGTAQMRAGFVQTMDGVVTTLLTDGLTDSWRRERVIVMTAIAPKAVRFLLPDQLQALSQRATEVAGHMADQNVKSGLMSFAGALVTR